MKTINRVREGENTMKSMVYELEEVFFGIVKNAYPGLWEDAGITRSLVKDMSAIMSDRLLKTPGNKIKLNMKPLMLSGEPESELCSVAMLFKINFHDGQSVQGAAFLDARAKDAGKNTFSSIKKDHLKRLYSIAHHGQLLLYDYDNITGMAFPATAESVLGAYPASWNAWAPYTVAAVTSAHCALALNRKDTGLYKASLPWSYQLCFRNLFGLDLDYGDVAVDTARGVRFEKGRARHLVLVSVAHGGADLDDSLDYDRSSYVEMS
ncbi:MAG TPA: hypothetical protein VLM75_13775 [Spirochaetota bacterium]|nr:hypothetical protein [Spirochaetota bacterium]